jgi:DNA-binding NarL/FixJ family response regulator
MEINMKIILVDDDTLVSMSLKMILEAGTDFKVIATADNGNDGIRLYNELLPDVIMLDIRMEPLNGIETAREILNQHPDAKILFLTTFVDDEYIIDALKIGAKGYILKQDYDNIIPALYAINSGQNVFGNEIITKIPHLLSKDTQTSMMDHGLSEKELSIIELVADGFNNKEIAEKLYLGEGTIRNYLSTILEKLNLRDRTQLAIFYYKNIRP